MTAHVSIPSTRDFEKRQKMEDVLVTWGRLQNAVSALRQVPATSDEWDTRLETIRNLNNEVLKSTNDVVEHLRANLERRTRKASNFQFYMLGLAVLVFVGMHYYMRRKITQPILDTIHRLNYGTDEVTSASFQISSSAQSLAEAASEQAASVEETSSTLEEMASLTKKAS